MRPTGAYIGHWSMDRDHSAGQFLNNISNYLGNQFVNIMATYSKSILINNDERHNFFLDC